MPTDPTYSDTPVKQLKRTQITFQHLLEVQLIILCKFNLRKEPERNNQTKQKIKFSLWKLQIQP